MKEGDSWGVQGGGSRLPSLHAATRDFSDGSAGKPPPRGPNISLGQGFGRDVPPWKQQ